MNHDSYVRTEPDGMRKYRNGMSPERMAACRGAPGFFLFDGEFTGGEEYSCHLSEPLNQRKAKG